MHKVVFSRAYSLAQAHLVSQDAVDAVLVQGDEPLDTLRACLVWFGLVWLGWVHITRKSGAAD